jgi:uncharacterized protein (TIGR03000 family)
MVVWGSPNVSGTETSANVSLAGATTMGTAAAHTEFSTLARIRVRVPANALVAINGQITTPTGTMREFVSPSIDPNREYAYTVEARWTENGREVDRTRKVTFFAGDRITIDFINWPSDRTSLHVARKTEGTPPTPPEPQPPMEESKPVALPPPGAKFEVAADESAHDGVLIWVNEGGLGVRATNGREYTYTVQPGAQITLDNRFSSLAEIKPSMRIRATAKNNNLRTALRIEALEKNADYVARIR